MAGLKITVLERTCNKELAEAFGSIEFLERDGGGPCSRFEDGQTFLLSVAECPSGFCERAWSDIQGEVRTVLSGGAHDFMKRPGSALGNCTSGIRPVIFRIERVDS